jgi:membrane fusion protein (multidrug efflux system)
MTEWMRKNREALLTGAPLLIFILCMLAYIFGGRYVSTEDAYLQAAKGHITSNVHGQVQAIYVRDNQAVKTGDKLFTLDDRPFKNAVDNAQAELKNQQLQVEVLKAEYKQWLAIATAAQQNNKYQKEEFDRQTKLAASGISSQMELNKATNDYLNSSQQLNAAEHQLAATMAKLNNNPDIPTAEHPLVQAAQANLDQALLNLSYTTITAPYDGIVTRVEQIQPGDYIGTGSPVFAIISQHDIWVEANFKETEITYMKPGQKATIVLDTYPDKQFKGRVVSMSPGTGATFAILPPENATGNWVKIVQRVPIRISIKNPDPDLLLGSGLSATVTVDTKHDRTSSGRKK